MGRRRTIAACHGDRQMTGEDLDNALNKLTQAAQGTNPAITREMVESWVGNQGNRSLQYGWTIVILQELSNGRCTPQEVADGIISHANAAKRKELPGMRPKRQGNPQALK